MEDNWKPLLSQLLGKSRSPLTGLFSDEGQGWIDVVPLVAYPAVDEMLSQLRELINDGRCRLNELPFEFPQSLDDFGLSNFMKSVFPEKYGAYLAQWSLSDHSVVGQQLEIQKKYIGCYPDYSINCLYFMIAEIKSIERVMYIGKAQNGLIMRFMNGPTTVPQNNNYIGDCRSFESKNKPNYTWRAKSAELRRRGVSKIKWCELPRAELAKIERELINHKLSFISSTVGGIEKKDPVNR